MLSHVDASNDAMSGLLLISCLVVSSNVASTGGRVQWHHGVYAARRAIAQNLYCTHEHLALRADAVPSDCNGSFQMLISFLRILGH